MKKNNIFIILSSIIIILAIVLIHQKNTYIITLVADKEIYKEIRITKNTTWNENIKKDKDGYAFIGWYDEEGNVLNNNTLINQNKAYYARWAKILTEEEQDE